MNPIYEKLKTCYDDVRRKTDFVPEIALVLGSGLGSFADNIEVEGVIDYRDIEGFPISTAPGHVGQFIYGTIEGKKIICMKGRVHYYEGYPISDVVLPVRLMHLMGANILFLTNASGGINSDFSPGDFMMLTDHISSFVPNPLVGENIPELGVRFPDMTHVYDLELCDRIRESAAESGINLKEGTYIQTTGPSYESPAEIRMFKTLGADAVGMSTVVEAIAAHHAGMRVCGVSCITNYAAGIDGKKLGEQEVIDAGKASAPLFKKLVTNAIKRF
ncbi:purine-nucleoside phosphorylase [Lachnospiraceae bacterium NE2001]|nr:purine-nucleoside phosphorylase [Lachnospiraceae bacterium NE2001]